MKKSIVKLVSASIVLAICLNFFPAGIINVGALTVNVTNNILEKRYPMTNQTVISGFNEIGNVEGFTLGENVTGLEVKTSIANGPGTVYSGVGCLQVSCSSVAADLWKTIHKNFVSSLNLSQTPIISLGFNSYGGGPSADYYLKVNLKNGTQTFESIAKVVPDKWNTITFDMSGCSFLNNIQTMEIGFMNNGSANWGAVYQVDDVKMGTPIDLSFSTAGVANLFAAENGTIAQNNGILAYTFASGGKLTSPMYLNSRNTMYNAVLNIRNTMFFVMENKSTANSVKVSFITEADQTYTESKSKTFAIDPSSPKKAYYFNFSDNSLATGRLCGFRIEPNGTGSIEIDRITFEEEKKIEPFAGGIVSCTANMQDKLISISGTVSSDYLSGYSKIAIYETAMYNISDNISGLTKLYEGNISNSFSVANIPLMNGKVTRLSSQFLAVVKNSDTDFIKISPRFYIENWRDSEDNPYEFTLPTLTVNATDYGATGNGFSDDTDSIQAAINYVSAQGGGQVVLGGDNSFYGKRYVATNILIKSNVDLHIEEGAIVWQSQEDSDYKYTPAYGHDGVIPGINWTHNLHVSNLPLIQGKSVENIKITGGGKIRSMDTGSEDVRMGGYASTCADRIHVAPIGMWEVKNIEISDVGIVRSNNYNTTLYACENIFFGNFKMDEVKCVSGDGIGLSVGTHNVKIVRSFLESNDDGIVLGVAYNDPRGILWWWAKPGQDNSIRNIEACHNYINSGGGKAIAFITWGTDDPNLENEEIYNIEAYDNVLAGGYSVGPWADNPYNGKQPFDNTETDDYSPVKNVRIYDNLYLSKTSLECIQGTNVITDCGIYSAQTFQNGDFAKGHTNWTMEGDAGAIDGHGYANNGGRIYEGLYLKKGTHTFTASVNGTGRMFIEDAITGVTMQQSTYSVTNWTNKVIVFEATSSGTYYLGVDGTNAMIDTATLTSVITPDDDISNGEFTSNFEDSSLDYLNTSGSWGIYDDNGNKVLRKSGAISIATVTTKYNKYENFEATVDIKANQWGSTVDNNFGFALKSSGSNSYFLEYSDIAKVLRVRRFQDGATAVLFEKSYQLTANEWHNFKINFFEGKLKVFINGTQEIELTDNQLQMGSFKISAYNVDLSIDNFSMKFVAAPSFVPVDLNFESGSTVGIDPGVWTVNNGVLATPNNNVYSSIKTTATNYSDFTASFDIQSRIVNPGADGNMGMGIRLNGDNCYFLEYNVIYNFYRIRKFVVGAAEVQLGIVSKIIAPNQWTHNVVQAKGRNIKWYVDGKLILDVTDNAATFLETGTVLFQGYQCSPAIDNIKIIKVPTQKSVFANFEDSDTSNFTLNNYALANADTKVLKTSSTGSFSTVYSSYKNFVFNVDFKINAIVNPADGNFGFIYRQTDNANSFYFIEYNPQNKFFQVRRVVNNDWATCIIIMRISMDLGLGAWHSMQVTSSNQNITVFIDNIQKASFVNDLVVQGGILINTYNNDVSVDNIKIINSDNYIMKSLENIGNAIMNIQPKTKVFSFMDSIGPGYSLNVALKNAQGIDITNTKDAVIGTGTKMEVNINGVTATYDAIIKGDLNGDGDINAFDLVKIKQHLLKITLLTNSYNKAADASGNGNISISDLLAIKKHLLGLQIINQAVS